MKFRTILPILILTIASCEFQRPQKHQLIERVYTGLTTLDAFKADKKDSVKYLPPPPPPFDEEIANNNFIESVDGRVFFYSFSKRGRLCGFMTENGKYTFEIYKKDLDTMKASSLILINNSNLDEILEIVTSGEKPICVSVGIQDDTTNNGTIKTILNSLYVQSVNNVWKVRRTNQTEDLLLTQKSTGR